MIYDLLDYFKDNPNSEQMILDTYTLKSGLYIRFNKDGTNCILKVDKNEQPQDKLYLWLKEADYYSCVSDTNKCFDVPKKVMHNNNYLTLFFKTKSIINNQSLHKDFKENVKNFYEKMIKKLESNEVKEFANIAILPEFKSELAEKNMKTIFQKIDWIVNTVLENQLSDNDYIKIFFEEDMSIYRNEYLRYYYPYIFNNNKFNINYQNTKYGLSAANMGLNTKKPFLEHKTTNFKVPFRISLEDAMDVKGLFEWLSNQKKDDGMPMNSGYINVLEKNILSLKDKTSKVQSMHYVHLEKGIDTIIDDYDFLPGITDEIEKFIPKNYLMIEYYDVTPTTSRSDMERMMDQYLYSNKLKRNYKTNPKDIKGLSSKFMNLLLMSRKAMEDFFVKGDCSSIIYCIDKVSRELVKEKINYKETKFFTYTGQALNMRFALLKYFKIGGKEDMGSVVRQLWNLLDEKINSDTVVECENDNEFYFASGQLARYIISQSEAKELKHNMVDPLINSKDIIRFKKELRELYKKYNHSFLFTRRFNNLLSMVMGYIPEDSHVNQDIFIAGLAARNLMYAQKEDEK